MKWWIACPLLFLIPWIPVGIGQVALWIERRQKGQPR